MTLKRECGSFIFQFCFAGTSNLTRGAAEILHAGLCRPHLPPEPCRAAFKRKQRMSDRQTGREGEMAEPWPRVF